MFALQWRRRHRWAGDGLRDLQRFGPGATSGWTFAFCAGMSRLRRHRPAAVAVLACAKAKARCRKQKRSRCAFPPELKRVRACAFPAKGEGGRLGAPPGDLHIITNVGTHKYFTRKGDNIYVTVPITVPEAALGAKIEVPTVEGKAQLRIPPGTQSGQKFRLRQRGAPSLRNPGAQRRSVCGSAGDAAESDLGRDEGTAAAVFEVERGESAGGDGTGVNGQWSMVNGRLQKP